MSKVFENKKVWSDEPSSADSYRLAYAEGLGKYIESNITAARALRR